MSNLEKRRKYYFILKIERIVFIILSILTLLTSIALKLLGFTKEYWGSILYILVIFIVFVIGLSMIIHNFRYLEE